MPDITSNLVGHWSPSIDDTGNGTTTLTDETGSNDGTLSGTSPTSMWASDNAYNGVRHLAGNGSDNYVTMGDASEFTFGDGSTDSAFSLSFWFLPTSLSGTVRLIGKASNFNAGEYHFGEGVATIVFQCIDNSTGGRIGRSAPLTEFQWVHVCITYSGSGLSSGIKIYINGTQADNADSAAGSYTAMEDTTQAFEVGRVGTNYSDAQIDTIRLYSRELASDDVIELAKSRRVESGGSVFVKGHRMHCAAEVELEDTNVVSLTTASLSTGGAADADAAPSYRVYEEETGTAILTGSMAKLDDANTLGLYSEAIACTAANGFEHGKTYTVYASWDMSTVEVTACCSFRVVTAIERLGTSYRHTNDDTSETVDLTVTEAP